MIGAIQSVKFLISFVLNATRLNAADRNVQSSSELSGGAAKKVKLKVHASKVPSWPGHHMSHWISMLVGAPGRQGAGIGTNQILGTNFSSQIITEDTLLVLGVALLAFCSLGSSFISLLVL